MTGIQLEALRKEFNDGTNSIVAVNDLDMDIRDGEFIVLVGPSGCGKTTTLRCIAGLEDVTSGHIRFEKGDVTEQRARDRGVAMVFQNYALYPHMSVRKNMSFGLRLSTNQSVGEIDKKVEGVARMMGIGGLLDQKPKELSGGQQQRVALGRAIVREPEAFLMDEPLSNLDAKLRAQMRTELQELQNQLEVTTIYVTHDQTEAMAMGDRIAVMNNGELQQIGEPETLYRNPSNEFVARFLGSPSINLFDVTLNNGELEGPGGFVYQMSDLAAADGKSEFRIGIRPEDVSLNEEGIPFEVTVVEKMGNENFVYGELGNKELVIRVNNAVRPEEGHKSKFWFDEESIYLFDKSTGDTIRSKSATAEDNVAAYPSG